MNTNTNIKLLIGSPIEVESEQQLIARLIRDLDKRGVEALLFANFFPKDGADGQVDLLVITKHRTAHVEIKGLNPAFPVFGGSNGDWVQKRSDGTDRAIGNPGRQARDGTHRISDAMRSLTRKGKVPAPTGREFWGDIDTIVGFWETVPSTSKITAPAHVTLLAYSDVLKRILTPGPCVPWSDHDWTAFADALRLQPPDVATAEEVAQRQLLSELADYQAHASATLTLGLTPLVDLGAQDPSGKHHATNSIGAMVAGGRRLALVGPSGSGKTFTARHISAGLSADRVVAWLDATDYQPGQLGKMMARATGAHATTGWATLLQNAAGLGVGATIVLDGLTERLEHRVKLLSELNLLLNRYSASLLVTSTVAEGLVEIVGVTTLAMATVNAESRRELLDVHGAQRSDLITDQFCTPYELAMAAFCESALGEDTTVAELHDAYIDTHAKSAAVRTGLRVLAATMHGALRSTHSKREATQILERAGLAAAQIDATLGCPLLTVDRHAVRFHHELLAQHLAAEHLVSTSASGDDLGLALSAPSNAELTATAMAIETNPRRRWDAICQLASSRLIIEAIEGHHGDIVQATARDAVRGLIAQAVTRTSDESVHLEGEGLFGKWVHHTPWTALECALLGAAGAALADTGQFVDDICPLLDATDALFALWVGRLQDVGSTIPITAVFSSTYVVTPTGGSHLAVSYLHHGAHMAAPFGPRRPRASLLQKLLPGAPPRAWSRYAFALRLADPDNAIDQALMPDLLRRSWASTAYHLRLEVLNAARGFRGTAEPQRSEIIELLASIDTDNIMMSSLLVETLAAFGVVNSGLSVDALQESIRHALIDPDDAALCRYIYSCFTNQFEDEDIVGPYWAAIDGLTAQDQAWVYAMATRGAAPDGSMFLDTLVRHLCDALPSGNTAIDAHAERTLKALVAKPTAHTMFPQEATSAWAWAVCAWGRLHDSPPEPDDPLDDRGRAWRALAALILSYERRDARTDDADAGAWMTLHAVPAEAVSALADLYDARRAISSESDQQLFARLLDDHADEIRALLDWALDNPEALIKTPGSRRWCEVDSFIIDVLGHVGNSDTTRRLNMHTLDPQLGRAAVDAIRRINQRLDA